MISPIINLIDWNVQDSKCSLMSGSKLGNCAIVNNITKKSIEIETPSFKTRYGLDDKYDLKIKLHNDEVDSSLFDKFIIFDQYILNVDKTKLFLTESKKKAKYSSIISIDETFIKFDCDPEKLIIIDKNGVVLIPGKDETIASLIPKKSNIICFIKFTHIYNTGFKYGIKKVVTKIQLLD